ncbi:MAG: beta-lactamase hydrolase domain-containing protein [Silanimonas sp.]
MHPRTLVVALLGAAALSACTSDGGARADASSAATATAATTPAPPPFDTRIVRDGAVLLSPQPMAADLEALNAQGVRRVINLRTPEEMATLGFDEAALAASKGIDYTLIPIAGNTGYTPAALDAFSAAMARGDGDILLHCASGTRAGHLYAAWLVREKGLSPEEAMRRVGPLGLWPPPMERLLEKPLRLDYAEMPRS